MISVAKKKEIDPAFGRNLRALREAAGLTQLELGERVGVKANAVARLEQGGREPGWGTVLKFAKALGVSTEAFRETEHVEIVSTNSAGSRPVGKRK